MFWAVQGMAAELSTGALVMGPTSRASGKPISMLVANNKGSFMKKAKADGSLLLVMMASLLRKLLSALSKPEKDRPSGCGPGEWTAREM